MSVAVLVDFFVSDINSGIIRIISENWDTTVPFPYNVFWVGKRHCRLLISLIFAFYPNLTEHTANGTIFVNSPNSFS